MKIFLLAFILLTASPLSAENTDFTGWMTQENLDNYFDVLNNSEKHSTYFDPGKRITTAEGRWNKNKIEYRVKIGDTPKHKKSWWFWWINQSLEEFTQKIKKHEKSEFQLIYAQSFITPDGSSHYQGVWYKEDEKISK